MEDKDTIPNEHNKQEVDLWEEIGFHKPLGGWWYSLFFFLINMFTGVFVTTYMISFFYPFPESTGYVNTVNSLFGLLFFTFDIGTFSVMERFVPEARIKDPLKMLQYIRYFIWYQMITGLVQVTAIGVYGFYFASETDLAYLVWIMLITSIKQYPGMLGVFHSALNSLQHFDKSALVGFTQGEIVQRLTELLFVYLGKLYGEANPGVGIILGIAIGSAIGKYVDDFIGMALAAYFFSKVMNKEGIRTIDCFIPSFPISLIKEVLLFNIKTSLPGFFGNAVNLYILSLYINFIPQYVTYSALIGMAGGIVSDINSAYLNVTPLYSESFMNGKRKLSQMILLKTWRFAGSMIGFFYTVFLAVYFLLPDAFVAFNILNYLNAIPFIIPLLIKNTIDIFTGQAGSIIYAANKPNVIMYFSFFEQGLQILIHSILILWLNVPNSASGLIFTLVFGRVLGYSIQRILMFVYVQKKLFKLHISWYQTVIAPLLTAGICVFISFSVKIFIYDPLKNNFGFFAGIIPFMIFMIIMGLYFYFPLYAFMGGWDEGSMQEFGKVVKMSGPSKIFVKPIFHLIKKACKISPLYNKFPIDETEALREAQELYDEKISHQFSQ